MQGNQGLLEKGIIDAVRFATPADSFEDIDSGHGRIETRKCYLYDDFSHIDEPSKWQNLRAIVKIEAERLIKSTGEVQKETRLYITSCPGNAKVIGSAVRAHWGVENSLHWVLDVAFGEDASRKREGHAAQNFSIISRIALNLVKNENSKKRSVKGKRLDAGWDNDYLLKIIKN